MAHRPGSGRLRPQPAALFAPSISKCHLPSGLIEIQAEALSFCFNALSFCLKALSFCFNAFSSRNAASLARQGATKSTKKLPVDE
jgi:hypothetical protein